MARTGTKRGPGRPPDLAKRRAILDATRELLAEVGYGSMTIDAVAQRAGTNRLLIYRIWDSKMALATDALFGSAGPLVVPDSGSTMEDLREFVAQQVLRMRQPAHLMGSPGLTVELVSDPEAFRAMFHRYIKPSEDGFRTILERGARRGEVANHVDPRALTYVVSGLTTSLAQGLRLSAEEITDLVMQALVGGIVRLRSLD